MTQATDSNFQQEVIERLGKLAVDLSAVKTELDTVKTDLDGVKVDVDGIKADVDGIKQEMRENNIRVDTYQKASTQVVNLAFSLIASATVTLIVTSVFRR
jgi:capsule polysaccharide export protein KpsE/RkpR